MNLQSITIIFIIIFLPIILITSFYIQQEITTVAMQSSYDTKLIDATSDALSAFEINTANEDLSSVSDYLRNIMEASTNVFISTLATNLGMSNANKSSIVSYVPAIVYTLYDGYYIYAPTQQPIVVTDRFGKYVTVGDKGVFGGSGETYSYDPTDTDSTTDLANYGKILYYKDAESEITGSGECTTNPEAAAYKTEYILKSFIPYSMRYERANEFDVTINYTLDNFINVEGTIYNGAEARYYTKSGYLLDSRFLDTDSSSYKIEFENDNFKIDEIALDEIDDKIKDICNNETIKVIITRESGNQITIDSSELCAYSEIYNYDPSIDSTNSIFNSYGEIKDNVSAIQYYAKAYKFSKWFYNESGLIDLNESDMENSYTDESGFHLKYAEDNAQEQTNIFYEFTNNPIFGDNIDPESKDSYFVEHKRRVIKNSIQYNLNLAMSVYNAGQGASYYQMPLLTDKEWDKVLSNISIIAFMQGLPCGMKTYNNYAIVTSNNNELLVNTDDLYYVPVYGVDDEFKYKDEEGNVYEEPFNRIDWSVNADSDIANDLRNYFLTNMFEGTTGVLNTYQRNIFKTSTSNFDECWENDNVNYLPVAHKLNCPNIPETNVTYYESFPSREVKYDKVYDINLKNYVYDHVCNTCYDCIISHNYLESNISTPSLQKAQAISIAKIRNNTYKISAFEENIGRRFNTNSAYMSTIDNIPEDCYEINVQVDVIGHFLTSSSTIPVNLEKTVGTGDKSLSDSRPVVSTMNSSQNLSFKIKNNAGGVPSAVLKWNPGGSGIDNIRIKSVEYKYK